MRVSDRRLNSLLNKGFLVSKYLLKKIYKKRMEQSNIQVTYKTYI